MNSEGNPVWPTTVPTSSEDFANFLDLPDLELDFSQFDPNATSGGESIQDDQAVIKGPYGQPYYAGDGGMREDNLMQKSASASDINMLKGRISGLQVHPGNHPGNDQHAFAAQHQMQFHNQGRIPPTPTSIELHGNRHPYPAIDSQQQAMYEAQLRKQQQDQVSVHKWIGYLATLTLRADGLYTTRNACCDSDG